MAVPVFSCFVHIFVLFLLMCHGTTLAILFLLFLCFTCSYSYLSVAWLLYLLLIPSGHAFG